MKLAEIIALTILMGCSIAIAQDVPDKISEDCSVITVTDSTGGNADWKREDIFPRVANLFNAIDKSKRDIQRYKIELEKMIPLKEEMEACLNAQQNAQTNSSN